MNSKQVKELARNLGVDLCGIAPVERFNEAPEGFRPQDIFHETKSVVVIAKRFPESVFASKSPVPYTFACESTLREVLRTTCELTLRLQDKDVTAVPVPSEPYEYWDVDSKEGRGILSLKHAGYLAGLGLMGKNTLLANEVYGNRMTLGALLVDCELQGDPMAEYAFCEDTCKVCVEKCPGKALGGASVVQKLCREKSQVTTRKGYALYACNACRALCPHGKGVKVA
jgi:epoxyqueuosine reductase